MPINVDVFYDAVLHGLYNSQAIVNVLHYRLGIDAIPGDLNLAGAEELANGIKDNVWPHLKAVQPAAYTLEDITVYPRNDSFALIYQTPFLLPVNEAGTSGGWSGTGASPCVILRAHLEPTTIVEGFIPPRRGYLAIGPVAETSVDDTGHLVSGALDAYQTLGDALATNIVSLVPAAVFFPIRVSVHKELGGLLTLRGWADVDQFVVRPLASHRRSRMPEE
jgi:hypothetical protein